MMRPGTQAPQGRIVLDYVRRIRDEMQRIGAWQDKPLSPEAMQFQQAFAQDTMAFTQWLQFVFVPRVEEAAATGVYPPSSAVGAQAVREFDGWNEAGPLITLLSEFDQLFPAADPSEDFEAIEAGSREAYRYCLNGHLITLRSAADPNMEAAPCHICGARTIATCPGCREPILGLDPASNALEGTGLLPGRPLSKPPQYCHCCGRPLPWTEKVMSAVRMAIRDLAVLDRGERDQLRRSIEHIVHTTAQTRLAVLRINTALSRLEEPAASSLRSMFLTIASDEARELLLKPRE